MIFKQMYSGGGEFVLNITSSVANPDIPALASAAGWNGSGFLKVNITAPYVNTLQVLNTWSFPSGFVVIISSGTLVGGRRGSYDNPSGGAALIVQVPCSVRNNGVIAGGGGNGGIGQVNFITYNSTTVTGTTNGTLGGGQGFGESAITPTEAQAGGLGVYAEYAGAVFGGDTRPWVQGGYCGDGGSWGQSGSNGLFGSVGGSYDSAGTVTYPTSGGAPGNSVIGNSFITWLATGTRLGPISA